MTAPASHSIFGHVSKHIIKERCIYLHNLEPSQRCAFVKKSLCDDQSELFQYHYLLFCGIADPSFLNYYVILYIFGMLIWFVVLFIILAITVDEYFCPALGLISKILNFSENLSGVTLLALGNGAPDILSAISSSTKGDTILMYNQILGGGMFVSCVVAGCIVISRPFYLQPYHFLRDSIFTLGTVIWIQHTTADETVTLWESCTYIGIYVVYIIIVVGGFLIQEKLRKYDFHIDKKNDVDWTELRRRRSGTEDYEIFEIYRGNDSDIKFEDDFDEEDEDEDEPETVGKLFKDFWISINPIHGDDWRKMNCFYKFLAAIKAPFLLLLNLFIPVVSSGIRRNGWCKLLNSFHLLIFPTVLMYILRLQDHSIFQIPLLAFAIAVGIVLALIVFCTSYQNNPPAYHCAFAYISFLMGILIIFTTVHEVVAVLSLFGTLLRIAPQTLGLTVLAWGNSLGDAVANIQVAKQGFQRMAFAGCFAGILANMCLSMGVSFLIRNLNHSMDNEARGGVMGPNCSVFFVINLSFSILYLVLTKFQARKSYGIFLFIIYAEFLLFCILCELEVIHPLGTDHEFAIDIFKGHNRSLSTNKTEL